MPLIIGGTLAGVGLVSNLVGGKMQADAQSDIAKSQQAQAQSDRDLAMKYATPSVAELAQLDKQYKMQDAELARQEKLISAIDPAVMEAGSQALKLLRGQQSAMTQPILDQRARQRQDLVARLRDQLGPGGEASSAGTNALNQFDEQTSGLIAGANQDALKTVLGTITANKPNPAVAFEEGNQTLSTLGGFSNRAVAAARGTPLTPYAGAPFVGAAYQGAQVAGLGQGLTQAGSTIATLGALNGGGTGSAGLSSSEVAGLNANIGSLNKLNSGANPGAIIDE
jgi:hypothetical protein